MPDEGVFVTLAEVANRAEVGRSAVSNWRNRYPDFPKLRIVSGREVFEEEEIIRWLNARKIPRNRLKSDENPGISYGERFLLNIEIGAAPDVAVSNQPERPPESNWKAQLWTVVGRLRETRDTASSLKFLLGLIYVRKCHVDVWSSLVNSSDWREMGQLLSEVSFPLKSVMGTVADSSVIDVVRLVNAIDFDDIGGSRSTAAQIADVILSQLERGMGRRGGHYTPADVARCLVELLDPQLTDRVYDPFCGSGELLCAVADRVSRQEGALNGWLVWGQTPLAESWLTSKMNLALHDVEADLGPRWANVLEDDHFPGQRFSRVIANPPFNMKHYSVNDRTWPFGDPPAYNANFAWLQHIVTKLKPGGRAAVIMADGAASSSFGNEHLIREAMVEAGVVECVIALPSQLFMHTAIPVTVWVLNGTDVEDIRREVLFIDARSLGVVAGRAKRRLSSEDIEQIVGEYRRWQGARAGGFTGTEGFSRAAGYDEVGRNSYILTPGRYTALSVERPVTARITAEFDLSRQLFNDLSKRAEEASAALVARLAALASGQWPMESGRTVELGTVCEVLSGPGSVPRTPDQSTGTPLVLPRNIRNNRVEAVELDVVPLNTAERLARYELASGDIVSARVGTLGRFGLVLAEQAGWLLGPGCLRLRPNDEVDPEYLTYYLGSPAARLWLTDHATGSVIQHVSAAVVREMPVWLPSLPVQRSIVEILSPFNSAESVYRRISSAAMELQTLLIPILMSPSAAPSPGNAPPHGTDAPC